MTTHIPIHIPSMVKERPKWTNLRYPEVIPETELGSFIFPDMRALHRLNVGLFPNIAYETVKVQGCEIYIVEQWTAQRKMSTIITSYTGNSQDEVTGVRVILPKDPTEWPGVFKTYYKELMASCHPKVINGSTLFITNLSSMSSSLYLIHVECGDIREVWDNFKINFDLKRLHCGGRQGLLLNGISNAALEKFSQVYKIPVKKGSNSGNSNSDNEEGKRKQNEVDHSPDETSDIQKMNACTSPVIELVTLVQLSLSYFGLLDFKIQKSGLFCEQTKGAIEVWWKRYGRTYMGINKPKNETTLGPTTVAALISLVLSCYFKLMVEDCISSKDPFDEQGFYSGIYTFQKKYGMSQTHKSIYFDEETVERLFEVSARSSNADIFKFKRVVKSRVQDMAGMGNFMHLSNDVLTTDLDTLVRNIHSGALASLWKGKGRSTRDINNGWSKRRFLETNFNKGNPDELLKKQKLYHDKNMIDTAIINENSPRTTTNLESDSEVYDSKPNKKESQLESTNGSGSSLSISSMCVNYDKNKYLRSHDLNMVYQKEFYRRKSIPFVNDGLEPISVPNNERIESKQPRLHRSTSLSQISNAVEVWELPFDSSVVRMARDLRKVQKQVSKQCCPSTKEDYVIDVVGSQEKVFHNPEEDQQFNNLLKRLHSDIVKCSESNEAFDHVHDDIENKHNYLLKEMKELNSLKSKLCYNVRIMNRRMRDVEDSVQEFDLKLNRYRKLLLEQQPSVTLAIETADDALEFDKCMRNLIHNEKTKYGGFCFKLLEKDFLFHMIKDAMDWGKWICKKFTYSAELTSSSD